MKKVFILFIFSAFVLNTNAQNSKKIQIVDFEPEIEASCDNLPGKEKVEFSSKCKSGNIEVDYTDIAQESACLTLIERTYTVTDGCGNKATFDQIIKVEDKESPKFSVLPPNLTFDNRVEYINSPHIKFPQVFDNCSTEIFQEEKIKDHYENGEVKLFKTYIATDACGNQISHTQEILFNIDH
ncbi:MAG: hypothetical protein AAF487_09280 [Bacteroidota bacterium]